MEGLEELQRLEKVVGNMLSGRLGKSYLGWRREQMNMTGIYEVHGLGNRGMGKLLDSLHMPFYFLVHYCFGSGSYFVIQHVSHFVHTHHGQSQILETFTVSCTKPFSVEVKIKAGHDKQYL